MTTDEKQTLRDDIAFMKALADEGVSAPLLAGPWLMLAGALFSVASTAVWAGEKFFSPPSWFIGAMFFGAFLLMMLLLPLKLRFLRNKAGHRAPANRATNVAWAGIGWGIFAFCTAASVACWKLKTGLPAAMIPTAVLVLYGAAWTVAASMSRQKFLWWVALACYASAIGINFFLLSIELYLIYAAVLVLVAFVPGYMLWKAEPKAIV